MALFRVEGDRAEELARCPLGLAWRSLFCVDSLLMCERSEDGTSFAVHEFGSGGGRFEPRRVLLSDTGSSIPYVWCVVNDALVAWPRGASNEAHSLPLFDSVITGIRCHSARD